MVLGACAAYVGKPKSISKNIPENTSTELTCLSVFSLVSCPATPYVSHGRSLTLFQLDRTFPARLKFVPLKRSELASEVSSLSGCDLQEASQRRSE